MTVWLYLAIAGFWLAIDVLVLYKVWRLVKEQDRRMR